MKAFQYLAALGLGATVTLGDAVLPAVAEPQPTENNNPETELIVQTEEASQGGTGQDFQAASQIAASAIALVPNSLPEPGSDDSTIASLPASTEFSAEPLAVAAPEASSEVIVLEVLPAPDSSLAQAGEDAKADVVEAAAEAVDAAASEAVNAPAPSRQELSEEVPVESGQTDPVEQEFNQEGKAPNADAPETEEAIPDALSESPAAPDATAAEGEEPAPPASATTLLDEQPNLLRPDESSEVSIEVNEAISLETAIEIARQNSPSIRVFQLQLEQSLAAIDQARAAYAPQFSVNSSFSNTGTLTNTNQLFREPDSAFTQDSDSNSGDAVVSLNGNARVDYSIIDPDRKASIEAAEISADQARLTLEINLSELRLTVSQAYYNLQEADAQVGISEKAVTAAQRSLKDAQALETAGVGTRFAVLQADVQLAIEQQNLVNNLSNQQQTRRQLAQILSTPEKLNLTVADPVANAGNWSMTLEQSIIQAYKNRVELDTQLLQRDLSEAQRKIALSTLRPNLTVFAQAGPGVAWNFNSTNPDEGADTSFGIRQATLGYQTGLNFQWLFGDGGATKAAARQQALNKAISEENFEAARDQVRVEVENAFYDLAANLRNISTSEQGVVQADEALRLARLRFQAGVGTQTEVVDAERDLTTSEGNRISAILNYNRALVAIERAVGVPLAAPEFELPADLDD